MTKAFLVVYIISSIFTGQYHKLGGGLIEDKNVYEHTQVSEFNSLMDCNIQLTKMRIENNGKDFNSNVVAYCTQSNIKDKSND